MNEGAKQSEARPIFRWLAGLTCPFFLGAAIFAGYYGIRDAIDKPQETLGLLVLPLLLLWGAVFFGVIAATGKFTSGRGTQVTLIAAAKKYAAGQMTLEEYGSLTKDIISKG
jgi:hypothetical protein